MTEDNAGYLIKLVANSLNRMLDQEMAPLDLTAMQWRPIAMLYPVSYTHLTLPTILLV